MDVLKQRRAMCQLFGDENAGCSAATVLVRGVYPVVGYGGGGFSSLRAVH